MDRCINTECLGIITLSILLHIAVHRRQWRTLPSFFSHAWVHSCALLAVSVALTPDGGLGTFHRHYTHSHVTGVCISLVYYNYMSSLKMVAILVIGSILIMFAALG